MMVEFDNKNKSYSQQFQTKAVKPKIFDFSTTNIEHFVGQPDKGNIIKFHNNSLTSRTAIGQYSSWKPKLPSKKLFEQPKFLLSLQRKKIRVINGIRSVSISSPKLARNKQFKSQKLKNPNRTFYKAFQPSTYQSEQLKQKQNQEKVQRRVKTPNLHFNMHHLINKKKKFNIEDQNTIKGSNLPYYNFFVSSKYLDKVKIEGERSQFSRLSKITKNRFPKTADCKNK